MKLNYFKWYKALFRMVFRLSSFFRKQDKHKVIISLYRSKELEGNLKFVSDELTKQMPDAKIHLISAENKMNLRLLKEAISLSNASYLILDDYYLPVYLAYPKMNLKVIQLWHAAGAFKKFGYSAVGTKFGADSRYLKIVPVHSNYTHVYVSSTKVVPYYAEAFHMHVKNIIPIGVPRTDLFQQEEKCASIVASIYQDFPMLKDKIVNILIAPTYRAKGPQGESAINTIELIIKVAASIDCNKRIIFKPHPYMNSNELDVLREYNNVVLASIYSINEWMLLADAFITDYSSSVFEFALLKKPIAHFIPDIKQYKENRGFYQDIEDISDGVQLFDVKQVVKWINERERNESFDTSRMVHYNFDSIDHVSAKVVHHFLNN
ncbi:CDP-glycerol glycerophosphotransferase family protein [Virgibacillus sp. NKC19-3]|uniref:CDP-glycerol glycerophosphotransferase family protein n=1 Tax=Virgibacillus saliphilus TaxID=2831674 RepID=UPI001C9A47F0|nr:CDP-glycerol glycerophosphotransferase family protein [Virgibacillus sp. NKC19-3]MBY7144665.1 CDP-glycerol glycerophosphotransferase family protein [Virgibacillus sp. NKC19-3]